MAPGLSKLFGKPSSSKPSSKSKSSSGGSSSRSNKEKDAARADYVRNKEIEKRIWEDKRRLEKEIKLILLGKCTT
jgi:hypothetical protein